MKRPCNFCGGEVVKGKCIACSTTYPKGSRRASTSPLAYKGRSGKDEDPDANGSWSNARRAVEEG